MGQLFESNSVLAVGLTSNIASTLNSLGNTTSNDSSSTDTSKQVRIICYYKGLKMLAKVATNLLGKVTLFE